MRGLATTPPKILILGRACSRKNFIKKTGRKLFNRTPYSWARLAFCLSTLEFLGLSCMLLMLLTGKRISSMVMVFSLKSKTVPISCKVCLPMIRLYNDGALPFGCTTISASNALASRVLHSLILPSFDVLKVLLEVLHDSRTALFAMGMFLVDPFSMKRRSPLKPVSWRTLIAFSLTNSLLLAPPVGRWAQPGCNSDWLRPFYFKLRPNLAFLTLKSALVLCEL